MLARPGRPRRRFLGVAAALMVLAPWAAAAEPKLCLFMTRDNDLAEFPEWCQAGDVIVGVMEATHGSLIGYLGRVCDFGREIVIRPPRPRQENFACVFTGRVLPLAERPPSR